jgi:hypothetical protein
VLNGKSSSKTTSTAAPVAVVSNKPKRFRTMLVNGALVREEIPDSDDDDDDTDSSSSDDGKPAAAAPVADAASPANHFASLQGGHVLRPTKKK